MMKRFINWNTGQKKYSRMIQVEVGEFKRHKRYSEKIWHNVNPRVPEGEAIYENLKAEIRNPEFEEAQQSQRKIHKKKSTTRHVGIKLKNSKTKQILQKQSEEKMRLYSKKQ